jgi:hypothetical protein
MKVGPSLKIYDIIQALKQKAVQQSPSKSSESKGSDTTAPLSSTQVTASAILQKQGLLQGPPQQRQQSSSDDVAEGGHMLTQHLLKGTGVTQHSRTLQAQTT